MTIRNLSLSTALLLTLITVLSAGTKEPVLSLSTQEDSEDSATGESEAREIARAYLAGISGGDLDELDALFLPEERSSVYENGSDEGDWVHYKEHHLAPEQEHAKNFRFTTSKEEIDRCGAGFVVRHVGRFTLEAEGETRAYRAAVSFVLVPVEGGLQIIHLHWSSRRAT